MEYNVKCVFEGICRLGEGPLWNADEGMLYWTDITAGRIWRLDPASGRSDIFWEGPMMVGGFAFSRSGGIVLCAEKGVYSLKHGKLQNIYDIPMNEGEIFNDITTDPMGRIFAGTRVLKGKGEGAALYRIGKDSAPLKILDEMSCSNGMAFSVDLKTFFHTDTGRRRVTAYDYDIETGDIRSPRVFFQYGPEHGLPDGLTVDSCDYLWQAFWGGWMVRRLSPAGVIEDEISVPARQPSSVTFGGEKLDCLYITTAGYGATDLNTGMDEATGIFRGGKVYSCETDVRGRPEWPADIE